MAVRITVFLCLVLASSFAGAQTIPLVTSTPMPNGNTEYALGIQILMVMTVLTLLPAMLMAILRQALGTQQTPSNQIILGLSLFLTLFIMSPVIDLIWTNALTPYLNGEMEFQAALEVAQGPIRDFMFSNTRDKDLALFSELGGYPVFSSRDEVPLFVLLPSFLTSELKTAFQIGFLLFVPFLVIDLVVASVLMSMGMMMLSPIIISLPFKLMLFVLIDGWSLISATLVASFVV
jgi:flagellar biosynthetic protein FliP